MKKYPEHTIWRKSKSHWGGRVHKPITLIKLQCFCRPEWICEGYETDPEEFVVYADNGDDFSIEKSFGNYQDALKEFRAVCKLKYMNIEELGKRGFETD